MRGYAASVPESLENSLPSNVMAIPSVVLDDDDCHITQLLTEDLVKRLASGQLSSVSVTEAFLRRAALAQQLVYIGDVASLSKLLICPD
jgi:hypothetical protein